MNITKKYFTPFFVAITALLATANAHAVTHATVHMPNIHGKSVTTPVAWGASNNVVFMGVGGTSPAPYTDVSDGAALLGFGIGDPVKNVGVQVILVSLDISEWDRYSMGVHLSKSLGDANAVGIGVENVMLTDGGDSEKSFYIVYSQGIQGEHFLNDSTGRSKLHFSVGAGTGRFGNKSPLDIASAKGEHGTYVFGNMAYEIADSFNLIADWNGVNLNAGVSKTFWLGSMPVAATIGAADLTDYSGDGVRFVFGVGTGFKL